MVAFCSSNKKHPDIGHEGGRGVAMLTFYCSVNQNTIENADKRVVGRDQKS